MLRLLSSTPLILKASLLFLVTSAVSSFVFIYFGGKYCYVVQANLELCLCLLNGEITYACHTPDLTISVVFLFQNVVCKFLLLALQ